MKVYVFHKPTYPRTLLQGRPISSVGRVGLDGAACKGIPVKDHGRESAAWDSILQIDLPEQARLFLDMLAQKIKKEIERVNALEVAEIGCGRGELIRRLARSLPHCRFVGYDLSASMISRLNSAALPNEEFECLSLPQVTDRSFDCVLCINTLHYVPESLLSIKRLWKTVRPGGLFIFNYPNRYYAAMLPAKPQSELWKAVEEPMRKRINLLSQKQIREALLGARMRHLHSSGRHNVFLVFEKARA